MTAPARSTPTEKPPTGRQEPTQKGYSAWASGGTDHPVPNRFAQHGGLKRSTNGLVGFGASNRIRARCCGASRTLGHDSDILRGVKNRAAILGATILAVGASAAAIAKTTSSSARTSRVECGTKRLYGKSLTLSVVGRGISCAEVRKIVRGTCRDGKTWSCFSFRAPDPLLVWFKSDERFAEHNDRGAALSMRAGARLGQGLGGRTTIFELSVPEPAAGARRRPHPLWPAPRQDLQGADRAAWAPRRAVQAERRTICRLADRTRTRLVLPGRQRVPQPAIWPRWRTSIRSRDPGLVASLRGTMPSRHR
jgi:hypothetical protein